MIDGALPGCVGAPCREKPASVVISLDGGDGRVLVGGQIALYDDGTVVGKGDMRAQIEQVGKENPGLPQGRRGEGVRHHPDAGLRHRRRRVQTESRYPDRYLGPESPTSTVNTVPKLPAGPDYLIEIEAVANLNSATSASATPEQ